MTVAQRLLLSLLLAGLVFNAARAVLRDEPGDFRVTYQFGATFAERGNIYEELEGHRTYPPFYAMVAAPFSLLPYPIARALWNLIDLACLIWILAILWRWIGLAYPRMLDRRFTALAIAVLLTLRFILNNAANGQNNVILVALSLAAIDLTLRGRPLVGGGLAGFAAAVKVVPALTLLYLFSKRQWRAVSAGFATLAVCTVLPASWAGPAWLIRWLHAWFDFVTRILLEGDPRLGRRPDGTWINHSLKYTFLRYFREYDTEMERSLGSIDLPPTVVVALFAIVAFALLMTLFVLSSRSTEFKVTPILFLEVGLLLLLFLILSPIAYKHHFVALIVINAALAAYLLDRDQPRSTLRLLVLGLFCGASILGGLAGGVVTSRKIEVWLSAYHALAFSALILLVAGGLAIATLRRDSKRSRRGEARRGREPVKPGSAK